MSVSVSYSKSGNGLSYLFKQSRPVKSADDTPSSASADQPVASQPRVLARSVIDSTGSGAAQVAAALTIYMSNLGSPDRDSTADSNALPPQSRNRGPSSATGLSNSDASTDASAAGLLRALDAYAALGAAPRKRMTA